jgi:mono/diheme cytochrome c family protein
MKMQRPSQPFPRGKAACGALAASGALIAIALASGVAPKTASATVAMEPGAVLPGGAPANVSACTGCHGPTLAGRKGFSPSLRSSGVLKEYNKKTFERVMKTGVTNDGGMVHKPMPVFHYTAKQSDALYAYFKKLK